MGNSCVRSLASECERDHILVRVIECVSASVFVSILNILTRVYTHECSEQVIQVVFGPSASRFMNSMNKNANTTLIGTPLENKKKTINTSIPTEYTQHSIYK